MLLVFDVNETLLDLAALDDLVAEVVGGPAGDAGPRREWFDRMIRSALTVTAAGEYVAFGTLAAGALRDVAAGHGREATDDQVERLAAGIASLPPHPDVVPALGRLRGDGHRLVALTNSVLDVATAQLAASGLADLLDATYSAQQSGRLKPAPEPYRLVLERERSSTAVLVAAHDWDVAGAAAAGLETAFIARDGRRPFGAVAPPTYVAGDLGALVDQLRR